ncbi:type II toxin-antitoxin system VapC family toxin [Tychonema bourrellyi]|uniref:type II toxin-antitoxin system VapC family toxin n=1 Tax=Tychonema bourrellyi TaxID=54313 RepID=UPI003CCBA985
MQSSLLHILGCSIKFFRALRNLPLRFIKSSHLKPPNSSPQPCGRNTWRSLEITAPHALRAAALPLHHRDPFDRMLIAQAQIEDMTLVSADSMFKQYSDITILWAANS